MAPLKAVYTRGTVVTGATHGEAFAKLPDEYKQGNDFVIGDWCSRTGRFVGDAGFFFTKKILLVRHAEPRCSYDIDPDPELSYKGIRDAADLAKYLRSSGEWTGAAIQTSPLLRCRLTAAAISLSLGVPFHINPNLVDRREGETIEGMASRIEDVMGRLPEKSVVISHCQFIQNVAQYMGSKEDLPVPTASMTLIDHNKVVYLGKGIPDETVRRS